MFYDNMNGLFGVYIDLYSQMVVKLIDLFLPTATSDWPRLDLTPANFVLSAGEQRDTYAVVPKNKKGNLWTSGPPRRSSKCEEQWSDCVWGWPAPMPAIQQNIPHTYTHTLPSTTWALPPLTATLDNNSLCHTDLQMVSACHSHTHTRKERSHWGLSYVGHCESEYGNGLCWGSASWMFLCLHSQFRLRTSILELWLSTATHFINVLCPETQSSPWSLKTNYFWWSRIWMSSQGGPKQRWKMDRQTEHLWFLAAIFVWVKHWSISWNTFTAYYYLASL